MSFGKLAAGLLAALAIASAQAPLPALRIEAVSGGSVFYIRNTYSQPATAYLIELVDYPGSSFWMWADIAEGETIPAGEEIRKPISNMTVGAVPDYVKVQAAIFADGATAGAAEKVAQLMDRRRAIVSCMRELIRRFEGATSKEALAADLKQWFAGLPAIPRGAGRSLAAINQIAVKDTIARASVRLSTTSMSTVLTELRLTERALAASKPAL